MTTYYKVSGMAEPFWVRYEQRDWPNKGDVTTIWHNRNADTDMSDLYDDEFQKMFGDRAVEITQEEFDKG